LVKAKKVKGIDCSESVVFNARKIIEVRLQEMLSFGEHVGDPTKIEEIHNLRIAAKRLRYTLEMFRFAFPKDLGDLISEVKEVQEHIGNMRDADVMIERVTAIIERDSRQRSEHLQEIAQATSRGTHAQRHQRIRSAVNAPKAARDEVALYTLIAHRAGDRDESYNQFLQVWERFEVTDFPTRLRVTVGLQNAPDEPESDCNDVDIETDDHHSEAASNDEPPEEVTGQ
jgi:hypothetical protein